jgi:broad specificity phosphatase PhoE
MEIILARHGETAWNRDEIFRGRADVPLNGLGQKQAELLSGYLSGSPVEAVYSSPLKRALETAAAIAGRHGLEVRVAPGLNDMHFGDWQGMPVADVREKYSREFGDWSEHPEKVRIPGGESLEDVGKRALGVVEEVVNGYGGTVVLVSHRVVNKVLICALLGLDNSHFWNLRQDTCGITVFSHDRGRFVLTGHNNTSYLEPLKAAKLADF